MGHVLVCQGFQENVGGLHSLQKNPIILTAEVVGDGFKKDGFSSVGT